MKNNKKIIVGDYLLVILAYIVLATSIIAVNMLKNADLRTLAYLVLGVGVLTIIYSIYTLNVDKELLN
jgi:uncharacterized membrane protein